MKKNKILINIIVAFIWLLILIILKVLHEDENNYISLKMITIFGLISNIYYIFSAYSIKKELKTPYILFQFFSLIFLYGHLFCKEIINYSPKGIYDLSDFISNYSLGKACILIMLCELGLHFGFLIYTLNHKHSLELTIDDSEIEIQLKSLRKLGLILLIISVIPALYDFYNNTISTFNNGYAGLSINRTYGIKSILDKIVPFFQISLMLLMVGNKQKKKMSRVILLIAILFYGIQMFFGNRGVPLISVIIFIWLYNIAVEKISKKFIIIMLIIVIPISAVLNTIRQVRSKQGIKDWISNADLLVKNNIKDNPLCNTLYEIGVTIYPISYTLESIPQKVPYKYGTSYLLSFISIVSVSINSSEKNSLAFDMNIAAQMTHLSGIPFGGSYIQEAYANFGWYSPLFMLILGMLLEMLDEKIKKTNNYINLVLVAYFLIPILWTVRNVLITLPREIVWYILPTYIMYKLIYNIQNKKREFKE